MVIEGEIAQMIDQVLRRDPFGIRHIPMAVPLLGAAAFYMKEVIKYPPQFKVGFLSNNPPVYDLPTQPAGVKRGNWIQTMPGKGWFVILRLYSPLEPFFTKKWRPSEVELVR